MDKWEWLDTFWNSFGWDAYDENSVPDDTEFPYITYSAAVGDFEHPVSLTASLWDRSSSWATVSQKATEISQTMLNARGTTYQIDGGRVRVWIGETPFAQRMGDDSDKLIRRIVINIMAEYLTAY